MRRRARVPRPRGRLESAWHVSFNDCRLSMGRRGYHPTPTRRDAASPSSATNHRAPSKQRLGGRLGTNATRGSRREPGELAQVETLGTYPKINPTPRKAVRIEPFSPFNLRSKPA